MGKRFDRTMMASLAGVWVALAVSGCANVGQQGAQTGAAAGAAPASGALAATAPASDATAVAPPGINADGSALLKNSPPLVYRVKRGDSLARIAQHHHCSVKQLQAWNGLKASSRLKLGQVLHVASPETVRAVNAANAANAAAKAAAASASSASVAARQPALASGATQLPSQTAQAPQSPAPSSAEAREVAHQTARHANGVALAWPAGGRVVEGFQPGETRGIEIGGRPGDPVRAAADGKVMYAGTGLNSYGSLIIVQHNKDFLTAYSHNRKLLVKTGDIVMQGQQIAEMGDEKNSRVSVGFELRRDGKPIDPMPYLPQGRG
ncbi:lipoprotein NlpD [Paraburkholderia sp. BL6665CI2N2]|uniref:peptidoglycan DD-metalloendopeptidase family protein n=1 Tax=Paraburkholderia sp. BL6665CI2N2 TaxID=1938806 RepID=UPI0010670A34|nr:peptidoglycan DD-metalloendopeptidase family protein [Paraburkholderia sp. BL6665CI2N2]TDY22259.1 lipoprotein NlpD [Paraburkholderia sp. BL6665CI2N2]